MTDIDNPDNKIAPVQDWMAQANAFAERRRAMFPENRAAILEALANHGIESVVIAFDGCGDSGQIENITASPETASDFSSISLAQKQARWESDQVESATVDLRTALENLAYELLEDTHDGWEINEGAFGEFTFDVGTRAITLDYNQRVESSEFSRHEF